MHPLVNGDTILLRSLPLSSRRSSRSSLHTAQLDFFHIFRDSFELRVLGFVEHTADPGFASYIVLVIGVRPATDSGNRGIKRFKSFRRLLRRSVV